MEKINFYTQSSLDETPELRMVIDVSGNVGIGESKPTKSLEVAGDISFNGNLYQNGTLFQSGGGGSTIDETTDVSLNNLIVHGDLSANDASFNVINTNSLIINGVDIIDGAPTALDTLSELAAALDNSANFATNVLTTLSNKQDTLTAGTNITITGNTISASGGGGGGLTDLSASSINDLSDVSFNSTSTTQGSGLIWNNTDKLWEPGTLTASITNTTTTTTVTNSGGWVNLNATNTPSYDYFGNLSYDGNDTIYFAGGRENSSTRTNHTWSYTLSTNIWSQISTSGTFTARSEHGTVYYNNALYIFAGWGGGGNLNDLYKLDLTQSPPTWSNIGSGSYTARRGHAYTMYGSKLIIFGGYGSSSLNDLYEIDLASGTPTWNQLHNGSGAAPTARYESTISVYQNKLTLFGGSTYTNDYWEFDLTNTNNGWSQVSTISVPPGRVGLTGIVVNDKFYIYGGLFNGSKTTELYVLDLTTYTWSEITTSVTLQPSRGHGITAVNNKIYVVTNDGSTTGYTYEYTIPITTTTITYNPVEINKLSTYYALSIGPNYDTSNMDNSGNLIVEGNVGIGFSDPSGYKLEVAGDISFNGNLYQNGALFTGGSSQWTTNSSDIYYNSGNVGIGTNAPTVPLEITAETNLSGSLPTSLGYLASSGGTGDTNFNNNDVGANISIKAVGSIWSARYCLVGSDRRIKTNIVDVIDNQALNLLRRIPCRYYEYKDKVSRGIDNTIGFIAQEVREHLPMAVDLQWEIIPDEYRTLTDISWNNTTLYTDLSDCSGVKYRFYVSNDLSDNDEIVKEVVGNADNSFTFDQSYNNVFCYGREVNDFHTLDKQKLFALNFSATQELDRIIQSQQTIIEEQQNEIEHLKLVNQDINTQLNTALTELETIKQYLGI